MYVISLYIKINILQDAGIQKLFFSGFYSFNFRYRPEISAVERQSGPYHSKLAVFYPGNPYINGKLAFSAFH
jgi:hypothetical protein